ncbi:MAG: protein kinase, partial [Planctomycetes bacterium]|nr:protein kinase [Planctomycetota bacterium]
MDPFPPAADAEDLFAGFLDRIEAGERVDFTSWVACHPGHADRLQRIHRRWLAMNTAFSTLAESPGGGTAADSATFAGLLGRLRGRGERWSRYAIGAEIARGAMGRVVRAWDQELRREVALKVQRGTGDDGRSQRRFVEEAQIAAQLDHPGIVPIHELGLDGDGRPFFAMRFVRGRDLGELLGLVAQGASDWSMARVLHVLLRVCEAMAYAHHKGVIHRDLKPSNIMVGSFGETYVMDWGLARVTDGAVPEPTLDTLRSEIAGEDDSSPLLTRAGDVVGTPSYMAPEQAAAGAGAVTAAVDVYAIGAILYHLLSGSPPYQTPGSRRSADEVLAALTAAPPAALADSTPRELRAICECAMARQPGDRYASVVALGEDLRAFLELRVVKAYAVGRFAELRKWIARNRGLSLSSAVFVVALLAAAIATGNLWLAADRAREDSDATSKQLAIELDRSRFRAARQAVRLANPTSAAESLRTQHLLGKIPRATHWALVELAERNPILATRRLQSSDVAQTRSGDGAILVSDDGRLQLLDPTTLETRRVLGDVGPGLTAIAASPALPFAVTGDAEGSVAVWDLERGLGPSAVHRHDQAVTAVAWMPHGAGFASGDGAGQVWACADSGSPPRQLAALGEPVTAMLYDDSGETLAVGTDHGVLFLLASDGTARLRLPLGSRTLASLVFSADGDQLWVGTSAHTIEVVDPASGRRLRSISTRNGSCRDLARDADGSIVAAGWWRIDRYVAGEAASSPLALIQATKIDLDPVGRRIATAGAFGEISAIDVADRGHRRLRGRGAVTIAGNGESAFTFDQGQLTAIEV